MKLIKINESQHSRLFEAYREGFSFDELSTIANSAFSDERHGDAQMAYCVKWLGEPNSYGSSRCVFTLSDNIILKLAYGKLYDAGVAQNELEYKVYKKVKSPLFPIVYDCDKNFTYLVSENVVPARPVDFEKILGIPFYHGWTQKTEKEKSQASKYGGDEEVGFDEYFENPKNVYDETEMPTVYEILEYIEANNVTNEGFFDQDIENTINTIPWFQELIKLVKKTHISDFCSYENFGMTIRNGKPTLVILDSGLNLDTWEEYYS